MRRWPSRFTFDAEFKAAARLQMQLWRMRSTACDEALAERLSSGCRGSKGRSRPEHQHGDQVSRVSTAEAKQVGADADTAMTELPLNQQAPPQSQARCRRCGC